MLPLHGTLSIGTERLVIEVVAIAICIKSLLPTLLFGTILAHLCPAFKTGGSCSGSQSCLVFGCRGHTLISLFTSICLDVLSLLKTS